MNNFNYQPEIVVDASEITELEWLQMRQQGIGSSDAPVIMETSPFSSAWELFHKKTKNIMEDDSSVDIDTWYRLNFGHAIEPFVAQAFVKRFNNEYKENFERAFGDKKIDEIFLSRDTNMYRNPLYPFMQANLDFVITILFVDGDQIKGNFECKTTSPFVIRDNWKNSVPYHYQIQGAHAMAVMNYDFTVFACAADNSASNYYTHLFFRDFDLEGQLVLAEKSFWEEYVQKGICPPVPQKPELVDRCLESVQSVVFSASKNSLVELPDKTAGFFEGYVKTKNDVEKLENEIKALKVQQKRFTAEILSALGKNEVGELTVGQNKYSVKVCTKNGTHFDKAALKKVLPALVNKYTKNTESKEIVVECSLLPSENTFNAA